MCSETGRCGSPRRSGTGGPGRRGPSRRRTRRQPDRRATRPSSRRSPHQRPAAANQRHRGTDVRTRPREPAKSPRRRSAPRRAHAGVAGRRRATHPGAGRCTRWAGRSNGRRRVARHPGAGERGVQPSAPSMANAPSRMIPAVAIAPSVPHRRAAGTRASVASAVVAMRNGITVAYVKRGEVPDQQQREGEERHGHRERCTEPLVSRGDIRPPEGDDRDQACEDGVYRGRGADRHRQLFRLDVPIVEVERWRTVDDADLRTTWVESEYLRTSPDRSPSSPGPCWSRCSAPAGGIGCQRRSWCECRCSVADHGRQIGWRAFRHDDRANARRWPGGIRRRDDDEFVACHRGVQRDRKLLGSSLEPLGRRVTTRAGDRSKVEPLVWGSGPIQRDVATRRSSNGSPCLVMISNPAPPSRARARKPGVASSASRSAPSIVARSTSGVEGSA